MKRRLGISAKYALVFSALSLAILSTLMTAVSIVTWKGSDVLRQRLKEGTTANFREVQYSTVFNLAEYLSRDLFEALYKLDVADINSVIYDLQKGMPIDSFLVADASGKVLTDGSKENALFGTFLKIDRERLKTTRIIIEDTAKGYRVVFSIGIKGYTAGYGEMVFSEGPLNKAIAHQETTVTNIWRGFERSFAGIAAIGFTVILFITVVVSIILSKRFSRPLLMLSEAAKKVADGDANYMVDIGSDDELADLSESFGKMVEDLRKRTDELRNSNDQMRQEIAERKRAEEERGRAEAALREKEMSYRTLAENLPVIPYRVHLIEGGMEFFNDMVSELTGYAPEELTFGTICSFDRLIHEDDRDRVTSTVGEAIKNRKSFNVEYRLLRRDGLIRHLSESGKPIFDDDGKPLFIDGVILDVTESREAGEKLHASREFIKNILETVDEGFIVVDRDFRVISANEAYCRQVKMPLPDIIGRHCHEISHRSDRRCSEAGEECAVGETFKTGEPHACVHKHHDRDGNITYVETKSFPLKDSEGNVVSAIEVINNITEKYLLEEQILRTQKLEAVGLLAGGIAHDFNNLLQGVFGGISIAKMSMDRNIPAFRMLEEAEKALILARNLTRQLLTFAKGGEPVKKMFSLSSAVEDWVKFALSGSNASYRLSIADDLWSVEADEGQISQVIQNIVLNASEAMPDGGAITIRAENVMVDKAGIPLEKGRYVLITIEDSGIGIPEAHLSRIFDPYFTTKQKGSGLGLATSYSIIKKHKGLLDVRSEFGVGSSFLIYLPASDRKPAFTGTEDERPIMGSGKILVMEDEEVVRIVIDNMLKSIGYRVEFAEEGKQAIDKYSAAMTSGEPFDAAILDLTIRGGMGGEETIGKLKEIDPDIKAIVSSGYADDRIISNYIEYGFKMTLSKPYRIEEMSRALYTLLKA